LLKTYRAIDAEIGRLAEAAGDDSDLFVYLSHGMGPHYDGTFLLDDVLKRIEGQNSESEEGALRGAVKSWLPRIRDVAIRAHIPVRVRLPIARWLRGDQAGNRAQRRYYVEPNNTVFSGIRLNLVGREPLGKVRPEEVEEVCAALTEDLKALVNVDSGGPAVRAVHRCAEHHRRELDDCLPDLFVQWENSVPIEAVGSPKIGTVRIPYSRIRTGDHRPDGLLLAVGPDFEAGAEMPSVAVEDIGPSLAARFGTKLDDVDGDAVPWLTGATLQSGPVPLKAAARR
jgi:predicted AlkP superfamily phosphohydrolase/phosphomutase